METKFRRRQGRICQRAYVGGVRPPRLLSLRISVKRRPDQTYALGLDEKQLETTIDEEIQYRNERGRLQTSPYDVRVPSREAV